MALAKKAIIKAFDQADAAGRITTFFQIAPEFLEEFQAVVKDGYEKRNTEVEFEHTKIGK